MTETKEDFIKGIKLVSDFLELLEKNGFIKTQEVLDFKAQMRNNPDIRNYYLKKDYFELTSPENPNRLSGVEAREVLKEKYFMGDSNIQRVLYDLH